jgi:hypothetical protein
MTNTELDEYYANLLIIQYAGKPKAYATMQGIVDMMNADQIWTSIQNAFNLADAVGVQLDIVGKYAGVTRYAQDFSGSVTLGDSDFRTLIKLKIVRNNVIGSLSGVDILLYNAFGDDLQVFDYANMHISYLLNTAAVSEQLAQIFIKQNLLPKPLGVALSNVVYLTDTVNYFSMHDAASPTVGSKGFNTATSIDSASHWIDANDTIPV